MCNNYNSSLQVKYELRFLRGNFDRYKVKIASAFVATNYHRGNKFNLYVKFDSNRVIYFLSILRTIFWNKNAENLKLPPFNNKSRFLS